MGDHVSPALLGLGETMSDKQEFHFIRVLGIKTYVAIFGALLALLATSTAIHYLKLGSIGFFAHIGIAIVMAGLILGYFMGLKFERLFHQLIFFFGLILFALFTLFLILDVSARGRINPEAGNFALMRDRNAKEAIAYTAQREKEEEALKKIDLSKLTLASLAEAKTIYVQTCLTCHGATGKGDGPAGKGLKPRPRDYTDALWQKRTSNVQIAQVILKGGLGTGLSPIMPAHPQLESKIAALVGYIRTLGGIDVLAKAKAKKATAVKAPPTAPTTQPVQAK